MAISNTSWPNIHRPIDKYKATDAERAALKGGPARDLAREIREFTDALVAAGMGREDARAAIPLLPDFKKRVREARAAAVYEGLADVDPAAFRQCAGLPPAGSSIRFTHEGHPVHAVPVKIELERAHYSLETRWWLQALDLDQGRVRQFRLCGIAQIATGDVVSGEATQHRATFNQPRDRSAAITFGYVNHRGEEAIRTATPIAVWHGSTNWHPRPQWLMAAWDHEKAAFRDFALLDCTFTEESV